MRTFPDPPEETYVVAFGCKHTDQAMFSISQQGARGESMGTYKVQADRMLVGHNSQTFQQSSHFEGPTFASDPRCY